MLFLGNTEKLDPRGHEARVYHRARLVSSRQPFSLKGNPMSHCVLLQAAVRGCTGANAVDGRIDSEAECPHLVCLLGQGPTRTNTVLPARSAKRWGFQEEEE